jgi:hypothetical protein
VCIGVVDKSFTEFCEDSAKWLERYKHALNAYTRMACVISEGFIIEMHGHHFTYFSDLNKIPAHIADKFFQEADMRHNEFLQKQENRAEKLSTVFRKVNDKLRNDRTELENKFSKAIEDLTEVELPASHKRVEAIINQNYLQRVGAIHGMN